MVRSGAALLRCGQEQKWGRVTAHGQEQSGVAALGAAEYKFTYAWIRDCYGFVEWRVLGFKRGMVEGGHLEMLPVTLVAACVVERWRAGAKTMKRARVGRKIHKHISNWRKVVCSLSV